ncbi:MAG TPA: hypothetical protein DD729_09125 [Rhodobacteraceae bacterium]|jgi:uncharacterized membrane protein YedE/YeeE|nr:hypothetical protein [Paracoccaceae bacterium]
MTLDWKIGGVALGFVFFLAVLLVKPIGVSTQFVITNAIIWNAVDDTIITKDDAGNYSSTNTYLAKSKGKYAKNADNPLNYSFVFVIAMMVGAAVSGLGRKQTMSERRVPAIWAANFGNSIAKRYVGVCIGGFIVIYGARLAGGCSSGHMMSGMMQTSISGYIFALGAFAVAIPTALILFRRG